MEKLKSSDMIIRIGLDQKSIPKKIEWKAEDDPNNSEFSESKAVLVSFFDKDTKAICIITHSGFEFKIGLGKNPPDC